MRRIPVARVVSTVVATTWFTIIGLGGGGLLAWQRVGNFYDAQAHAWLQGRWNVPASTLGIEAFVTDGRAYMYFGPTPAVFRVPFVAVLGHRLDGRLTLLSMIVACAVSVWAMTSLLARMRAIVDNRAAQSRRALVMDQVFVVALAVGSPLLFLASRAWVYHEAIIWGAAAALCALDALVAYLDRAATRHLVWFGVFSVVAMGARPPAGIGLVVTAVLVAGFRFVATRRGRVARWCRDSVGAMPPRAGTVVAFFGVAALAVVSYAAVNFVKFHMLFGIPADRQAYSQVDPVRQAFLRRSGGTFFLAEAIPSNLWQWVRPDMLGFSGQFPYVTFPSRRAHVFGNVPFDTIDWSTSITAVAPLLAFFALAGVIGVFRRSPLALLRAPILGMSAGAVLTLSIAYVAQRYQGDFLVVLVPAALAGWVLVSPWLTRHVLALVAVGGVALWGAYATTSVATVYQRQAAPHIPAEVRAEFLGWQRQLPGGAPAVGTGDALPGTAGGLGQLFAVNECAGLYQSDGKRWWPVERDARAGHFDVRVDIPRTPGVYPLVGSGVPGDANLLALEVRADGRVRFLSAWDNAGGGVETGEWVDLGRRAELDVAMDPYLNEVLVRAGTEQVFLATYFHPRTGWMVGTRVGEGAGPLRGVAAPRYPATIAAQVTTTSQCRALTR